MATFKDAFAAARKKLGAGKTFNWNGKSYSTNTKEDASAKSSPRPKARPMKATASATASAGASATSAAPKLTGKQRQAAKDKATAAAVKRNIAAANAPKPQAPRALSSTEKQKMERQRYRGDLKRR